jgi:hypothetical protein
MVPTKMTNIAGNTQAQLCTIRPFTGISHSNVATPIIEYSDYYDFVKCYYLSLLPPFIITHLKLLLVLKAKGRFRLFARKSTDPFLLNEPYRTNRNA